MTAITETMVEAAAEKLDVDLCPRGCWTRSFTYTDECVGTCYKKEEIAREMLIAAEAAAWSGDIPIAISEDDETLMRDTLAMCHDGRYRGFHITAEHYRYLAEQIIALRAHIKRLHPALPETK
jgi:hypothetical protein